MEGRKMDNHYAMKTIGIVWGNNPRALLQT